jgi:Centromere DNA-binding protein complex CBF3 subunit, domain 2
MLYETQLNWINRMFTSAGVVLLKKTHTGRSQGAKHAELNSINEGQIRRTGLWNHDALMNYYLTHLPRKFMLSMAGFPLSLQGAFFLPRARVLSPQSLERVVWPFVDEWLKWFDAAPASTAAAADKAGEEMADHCDLAAQRFLRLLQQFRIVFRIP